MRFDQGGEFYCNANPSAFRRSYVNLSLIGRWSVEGDVSFDRVRQNNSSLTCICQSNCPPKCLPTKAWSRRWPPKHGIQPQHHLIPVIFAGRDRVWERLQRIIRIFQHCNHILIQLLHYWGGPISLIFWNW